MSRVSAHTQLEPHHLKPPPSRPLGLEWVRASAERTVQGVRLTNRPLENHLTRGILSFSLDQFNSFRVDALSSETFVMVNGERFVPATRLTAALIDSPATIRRKRGWLAATIDLTVRSAGLTSDLLAARLGALRATGLLALVFLTHRLARLLDMTTRLIIMPCAGFAGCVRVLESCIRTMLSLALLSGPLALLLELMAQLGIASADAAYRIPLPALLVDRAANEYNVALPDAINLVSLAIGDGLLFLSLLLLAMCGVGRLPRSHEHIYTPERRRVEEAERLLSDAVLSQCEAKKGAHDSKRLLHLSIPRSASRPLDRPSLNRLRANRAVTTLDYFNSDGQTDGLPTPKKLPTPTKLPMPSSPSYSHVYAAAQLETAMTERSHQVG